MLEKKYNKYEDNEEYGFFTNYQGIWKYKKVPLHSHYMGRMYAYDKVDPKNDVNYENMLLRCVWIDWGNQEPELIVKFSGIPVI
jgi:hypothetical protein